MEGRRRRGAVSLPGTVFCARTSGSVCAAEERVQQLIPFQSAASFWDVAGWERNKKKKKRKNERFFFFFWIPVSKREREGIFPEKLRHLLSAVRREGEEGIEPSRSRPRWSLGAPPPPAAD